MYAHAQAPVRIGIAGGGTDLPAWTKERTGYCLSLAIKSYTHAVAIHRPDGQVVASYRNRDVSSAATEIANGLIRESALMHGWEDSFEVHTLSEVSSLGSGLGVSSSIAVALGACFRRLNFLRAKRPRMSDFRNEMMRGEPVRLAAASDGAFTWEVDSDFYLDAARDAWTVEIDKLKRPIGRQDHMAAAHGGLRLYSFEQHDAAVERSFSNDDAVWVAQHLLLVKLPEGHDSRAILSSVKSASALEAASHAVPIAVSAIENRDASLIGSALDCGQESKRSIPGAVPEWLRNIIYRIREHKGVYGCKVTGAGGGGHVVVARNLDDDPREWIETSTGLQTITVEPDLTGVRSEGWL